MDKNNNALFYTCSLIEYISRETKNPPKVVIGCLGDDVERIYNYQDVFHAEPIAKVANDFILRANILEGDFDNISKCKYDVPGYWAIGKVFERLIEDCYSENEVFVGLREVYNSWFADRILNFNSDLYYQSRDYLAECYRRGYIIVA